MTTGINLACLVRYEEVQHGQRYRVGHGDGRQGQHGRQIGTVSLKHAGGHEVVLQLDSGRIESFSPYQLFPETS